MADLVIKPATGLGNRLVVKDQGGTAVITTADSGVDSASTVIATKTGTETLTNKTLDAPTVGDMSNCTFPAGHHLQTYWDSLSFETNPSMDVTTEGDRMGSDLQVTLTPKSTSNVLNVRCFIPDLYNHSVNARSLMAGFRYSTASDFSSSVKLGDRQYPASHELYNSAANALLSNLSYEVWIAPPTTSTIWIRPWLCSTNGAAFRIFANAQNLGGISNRETAYLSVTEIQQ